jgi:RTX calcium-binding nonapeptide repeat (4 copies)
MAFIDDLWEDAAENTAEIATDAPDDEGKVTVGEQGDDDLVGSRHGDLILGDPTFADDQGGDDTIRALGGDDEVRGFGGDNVVHGGAGDDTLTTADGDDEIFGGTGDDDVQSGRGQDVVRGGPGNDALRGGEGDDLVLGEAGDDRVAGSSDDDIVVGGPGDDLLEGRDGVDTFVWGGADEGSDTLADFGLGVDRLRLDGVLRGFAGGEGELGAFVRFVPGGPTGGGSVLQVDADGGRSGAGWEELAAVIGRPGLGASALYRVGDLHVDDLGPATPFRALEYVASYGDLVDRVGVDAAAGKSHYLAHGHAEGRQVSFDGLQYVASHGDLIEAFGADREAGCKHYIRLGHGEGRVADGFDEDQYLANHGDLRAAFGGDGEAATVHYIEHGYAEGRSDEAPAAAAALDFMV